ncbi:MAG TPA: exodeoxyribonuclease VII large subunit [Rubrobacteraceae bacterium]|nr:exodeoxyribonuclease VII large subunit [Rubrobacteraceae bacterium]
MADRLPLARAYSPGELSRVLEKQVEARLGAYSITGLELEGVLGEIGEDRGYARIYGVHLADAAGGASFELSLPRRLAEKARGLEHARVRVRGDLGTNLWRGRLSFRLDVREMETANARYIEGEGTSEADRSLSSVLRGYRRFRVAFPTPRAKHGAAGVLSVCVIHPVSGQVLDDFLGQLQQPGGVAVDVHALGANMGSADEVREAVAGAEGFDIVALIRGGGARAEFEPLNDVGLLRAWMEKKAYTVSAIGHSGDSTLLDAVSDASCETPTAAGAYIRESAIAAGRAAGTEPGRETEWLRAELRRQKRNVALLGAVAAVLFVLWVLGALSS